MCAHFGDFATSNYLLLSSSAAKYKKTLAVPDSGVTY